VNEKIKLQLLVLGGLLHDVGKFAQRAGAPMARANEGDFLRDYKGKPSHWHVLYTDYFIENHLPLPEYLKGHRSRLAALAAGHHKPDSSDIMQACIAKGDRLASGWDRREMEVLDEDSQGYKKKRLNAVQDEVQLLRHDFQEPGKWFIPLKKLAMERDTLFPVQDSTGDPAEYKALYESFLASLKQIPSELGFEHYLSCLLRVLEDYTWCIPSATYKALPDISLYDHSLCTAAVAQALYAYHSENKGSPDSGSDETKFLLLGGDLSGIQNFIFNVSESRSKGAGKLYRARSFYLQALSRSVVLNLLSRLQLYAPAQLMDAGGKFMVLAPNTARARQALPEMQKELDTWMVKHFNGQVSLSLASVGLSPRDLDLESFHEALDDFNGALEKSKSSRLITWLQENAPVIHQGYDQIAQFGPCEICGIHPVREQLDDEVASCGQCLDLIRQVGRRLPRAKLLEYNTRHGIELFGGIRVFLHETLKIPDTSQSSLIQQTEEESSIPWPRSWIAGYIPEITPQDLKHTPFFDLLEKEHPDLDLKALSQEDLREKTAKTFHLIAQKARHENETRDTVTGRPLLGVLKADVDDLGLVFTLGLQGKVSLSRFASLSRMFSAFFSGYLVRMIRDLEKFRDTYVVFSGGDDLFMLGPWKQTLELADHIRSEFQAFCGFNPDMSLSCGLALTKPRFPLRRSAPIAEKALDAAKKRSQDNIPLKNGVGIFDQVLSWSEFKEQMDTAAWLEEQAKNVDSGIKVAFLYRMLTYARQAQDWIREAEPGESISPRSGLYLSHAHYDIARNIMRKDKDVVQNPEEVSRLVDMVSASEGAEKFVKNSVALQCAMSNLRK